MKLIKILEERIEDEIEDIKHYGMLAAEVKDEHPSLAHTLRTIAAQEDGHQAMLHGEVVKLVQEYRKTHGEPPAAMMAVYDYLHKRHMEKLAEARRWLEK